jgi:hypothetical protein
MMVLAKTARNPESRIANRFECTLGVGIEKIMFAERCGAALDGFDATQHCAGVQVLRTKDLRHTVDPFEPRQEREIFPYGAQQDLV